MSKVHFEFKILITPPYLDLASPCCCVEVGRDDRSKRSQMSRRLMISGWMGRSSFLRNNRIVRIEQNRNLHFSSNCTILPE
jgi:hypothetical protein